MIAKDHSDATAGRGIGLTAGTVSTGLGLTGMVPGATGRGITGGAPVSGEVVTFWAVRSTASAEAEPAPTTAAAAMPASKAALIERWCSENMRNSRLSKIYLDILPSRQIAASEVSTYGGQRLRAPSYFLDDRSVGANSRQSTAEVRGGLHKRGEVWGDYWLVSAETGFRQVHCPERAHGGVDQSRLCEDKRPNREHNSQEYVRCEQLRTHRRRSARFNASSTWEASVRTGGLMELGIAPIKEVPQPLGAYWNDSTVTRADTANTQSAMLTGFAPTTTDNTADEMPEMPATAANRDSVLRPRPEVLTAE